MPDSGAARLADFVFRGQAVPGEAAAALQTAWDNAAALVANHVGKQTVPAGIAAEATLVCGAELFWRRGSKSGIIGDPAGIGGEPVRLALDPMLAARQLLDKWLVKL
jgi:hypothetical protein